MRKRNLLLARFVSLSLPFRPDPEIIHKEGQKLEEEINVIIYADALKKNK